MPQSGAIVQPLGRRELERGADPGGDRFRRLDLGVAEVERAEDDVLARELGEDAVVEPRLGRLDRDLRRVRGAELAEIGVATRRAAVDDRGVAEADVERGRARRCPRAPG